MELIYFKTRDSLLCVHLKDIGVIKAEGNYSRIYYLNKHEVLLTVGIGRLETILRKKTDDYHFVRLGRSIIVNHKYFQKIDLQKQTLELSNRGLNTVRINIAKSILKSYKDAIEKSLIIKRERLYDNR
jgi:DNA-binding LytR/AlgR family response regulator